MKTLYHLLISNPLYNGLVLLINFFPFFDAGVIVIIFTIIIKLILLPLSIKASLAQIEMKSHEKALNEIKEKHKDNKEEHAKKQIEYYKEHGINPFASLFILIVQLPIIIGLYQIFINSGLPNINTTLLYSFVSVPVSINMMFLNIINITEKSLFLAVIVGITTYFQVSTASNTQQVDLNQKGMQADIARNMTTSMKYFLPLLMFYISYRFSVGVALYLITSNLFAIAQEIYIKKKYHKQAIVV